MKFTKKIISLLLVCAMLMSSGASALAQTVSSNWQNEEELRLAIRGTDEDVAAAPQGRFEFLATQMITSEDIKSAEITVLRKGGTEGPATVTLKIIDISAEYGKDYVLKVPVGIGEKTLPKNCDAPPLLESFDEEPMAGEGEPATDEAGGDPCDETVEGEEETVSETVYDEGEIELQEITVVRDFQVPPGTAGTKITGLAKAYENSVGREPNLNNWRPSTPDESREAKEANDRFLSEIGGVTYDLIFSDGEYIKKLYFCTLDDDLSESEEQVVLTLQNPTAGLLGDLNTAYVNIKDNDEFERPEFALKDKSVYVSEADGVAKVTLIRTAGLYHYASLIAATAGITALEDVDYKATSQELFFVPGVVSQTVKIPLIRNEDGDSGNKAFSVMFGEKKDGGFNEELTALVVIENGARGTEAPCLLNSTFLNEIDNVYKVSGQPPPRASMTPLNPRGAAAPASTGEEIVVNYGRDSFREGPLWCQGRYGFNHDPDYDNKYPRAVYVERKAGSCSTMYLNASGYGADEITWTWLNDYKKPTTAVSTMGFLNYPRESGMIAAQLKPKYQKMGLFDWGYHSYTLSANEKLDPNNQGIYFQTSSINTDSSWLYVYDVQLHYKKYKFEFGNTDEPNDPDIWIQPRIITGTDTSVPDGNKLKVGGIKLKDETAGFLNDTITFEPVYSPGIDPGKVYLWGFKVENELGKYEKCYEGNTFRLTANNLRELNNAKALLGGGRTIKVKPIFKQNTNFVQVKFDKPGSGISGFNNLDDLTLNAYDTIRLEGYAKSPDYVAGYLATGYNRSDKTPENQFPYRPFDISGQINPVNPGKIDKYIPTHVRELLTMLYGKPELNVRYHPVEGENDAYNERGEVAVGGGESPQTGRYDTPILVKPLDMDKTYQLTANPAGDQQVWWYDFTGDLNGDGVLSPAEKLAMKDGNVVTLPLLGNTFYYRPVFPGSRVYYTFKPKSPDVRMRQILGNVFLKGGTILNKNGVLTPIEGAAVSVGNDTVYTDESGFFMSRNTDYQLEGLYSIKINYKDFDFISQAQVSVAGDHIINAFDALVPEDFTIYKTPKGEGERAVEPNAVDNGESVYRFVVTTRSTLPAVKAEKATFRIYSKDGKSLRYEQDVTSNSNVFALTMVPSGEGILPGDYMTLQLTGNNGETYFENKVGFDFIRSLDMQTFDFIQSFETPITPVLDLFGKVQLVSDIGLAGNVRDYFTRAGNEMIMNIGFSKAFGSTVKTIQAEDVAKSSETPEKQKEATDGAVAKDGESGYKRTTVTRSIGFNVACAMSVIMELNDDLSSEYYGEFYFKQMVLMGSIGASYGKKYEYMTPLGIPVFITWDLAGQVTLTYLYEQYDNKKFYFNEERPINLANSSPGDTNRDFTLTGNYFIVPSITLGAGVGYDLLNVSLNGRAVFQLNFTSLGQGKGDIVLSAFVKIKILFFTKSWELARTSFGLFSYGARQYALLGNRDFRYDSIDTLEQLPRDYLQGRTPWGGSYGSSNKLRLFAATDGLAETVLQGGSYPHPETGMVKYGDKVLMVFIDDDGTRTAENRTVLKYSIFDGSGWSMPRAVDDDGTLDCAPNLFDLGARVLLTWSNGSDWLAEGTNVMDTLSCLDICGAFFDKATGQFGEVSPITRTTAEDISADTMPTVAYDEDSGKLILYYTKTEYEAPTPVPANGDENEETKAFVGDLTNGFSLIAYTFYDDLDGWKSSWNSPYTDAEKAVIMANADPGMTAEEFNEYQQNWYGQQFLDLAPRIEVDESGVMEDDVHWQQGKTPTVTAALNDRGKVLESTAISYNQLSLFAYVLDADGDNGTFDDQDIYLQIYDFKTNIFTHPIQLTNDDKKDANIRFIRYGGETYLYYISGGDIIYTNISSLVKTGLKKEAVAGREFYILDKSRDSGYDGTITVVTHREGNPVSEFEVKADDKNNVYIVWPEILITYKEGIDPTSGEATLPENQYRETQIFITRCTYGEERLVGKFYDDDGHEIPRQTYEETSVVDNWSLPVQYTHEKGANLTGLDFVVMDNGNLKAVYNKSYSIIMDGNHIANDENHTALTTADFIPTSQILVPYGDITFAGDVVQAGGTDYISAKIINDGLETLKGYKVKIYQCQNDAKTLLWEKSLDDFGNMGFPGGKAAYVGTTWQAPESLEGLYIEILVEDRNGDFLAAAQKDVESRAVLSLGGLEAELTDLDTATVGVTITNMGNRAAEGAALYIYCDGVNIGLSDLDLASGESKRITMDVNLSGKFVSSADEDGNVTEKVEIEVMTRDESLYTTLGRTASAGEIGLTRLLSNTSFLNQRLSIGKGSQDFLLTNAMKTYDLGGEKRSFDSLFDIVWKSSDENVARVFSDGSVVGVNQGVAQINAYILPKSNTYYATNLTNPTYVTGLATKAGAAVKRLGATVTVGISGGGSDSSDPTPQGPKDKSPQPGPATPADGTQPPGSLFKEKALTTKAYTPKKGEEGAYLVMVDRSGNIVPFSYYDSETGMMVALVDDPSADYEVLNVRKNFGDIDGNWCQEAVLFLAARNIIIGVGQDRFAPDAKIKRADFVLLLVRLLGLSGETQDSFRDVDPASYYANAISVARQYGFIAGVGNGNFSPESEISRQDMFTMAYTALRMMGVDGDPAPSRIYTDSHDIAEYAREAIGFLSKLGLVNGYNGAIDPLSDSKRSETAQFIYNIFKYIVMK